MIIKLLLSFFIAFEIQKLLQFNTFFKLRCISTDYNNLIYKKYNKVSKSLEKISYIDILYIITLFVGLFSMNNFFFSAIIISSFLSSFIFKIKNNTIRKIYFAFDSTISIIFLILSLLNIYIFNIQTIELVANFLKI